MTTRHGPALESLALLDETEMEGRTVPQEAPEDEPADRTPAEAAALLWLYAVVPRGAADRPADGDASGRGLHDEPLRAEPCGAVAVVVGELDRRPSADRDALRGHDRVVREIWESAEAVLPVRFGQSVPDAGTLRRSVKAREDELLEALERVRGAAQMTLRLFGTLRDVGPAVGGPGTRYLERRRPGRVWAAAGLEDLAAALAPMVLEERVRRHDRPPLAASIDHLVKRRDAGQYMAAIAPYSDRRDRHPEDREHADRRGRPDPTGPGGEPGSPGGGERCRVACSGAAPPYAFAAARMP